MLVRILFYIFSFSVLVAADYSPSAEDKESYDMLKKDVMAMVKSISNAACKKDSVGVLRHHWYMREKWQFTKLDELQPYIEKKYGRELHQKDIEEAEIAMRKAWRGYFEGIRTDVAKGKDSILCGAKFVSFKGNPLLGAITAKIKLSNDEIDIWDIVPREPERVEAGESMMIIDLDSKSRSLMKKKFPYVKFSAEMMAESNNP